MKSVSYFPLLLLSLSTLFSCNTGPAKVTNEEIIRGYFDGVNEGDFHQAAEYVSDSILVSEFEYIIARSSESLYQNFQWDSVFEPRYAIKGISTESNLSLVTISKTSKRIGFLQGSALEYRLIVIIKNHRISSMQTNEYINLDFEKWEQNRIRLNSWIDANHPYLSGFMNDLTIRGARNYLQAIKLFRESQR
jgi:hypothetical protein